MVILGKFTIELLIFKLYNYFLYFSDNSVEPLRISLENIPLSNQTQAPYLQFILDPACKYRIE